MIPVSKLDSQRAGWAALREGSCFGRNKALELSHLAEQRDIPGQDEGLGNGWKAGDTAGGFNTGGLDLAESLT